MAAEIVPHIGCLERVAVAGEYLIAHDFEFGGRKPRNIGRHQFPGASLRVTPVVGPVVRPLLCHRVVMLSRIRKSVRSE